MTRRWPCIVVATLGLLVLVTSASAECAWVVWAEGAYMKPTPLGAFPEFEQCHARELEMSQQERRLDVLEGNRRLGIGVTRYTCLPDTVDPRGPKGPR
jgi:hypothetical protein